VLSYRAIPKTIRPENCLHKPVDILTSKDLSFHRVMMEKGKREEQVKDKVNQSKRQRTTGDTQYIF
jgi:hypothetical protein